MKIATHIFLIFSVLFSSCVSPVFTISQVMEKEYISRKLINKQVNIVKNDAEIVKGYLKQIESDSLTIIQTNRTEIINEFKIANSDIQTITAMKKKHPGVSAGIIMGIIGFVAGMFVIGATPSSLGY